MRLVIEPPQEDPVSVALDQPAEFTLGRDPDADIPVLDPRLSRHHLRLRWNGETLHFHDLGSSNGIRLDGRPALEGILQGESVLTAGNTKVFVREEKTRIAWDLVSFHGRLLERLNLRELTEERLRSPVFREEVGSLADALAKDEQPAADESQRSEFVARVLDEVFGLGPLEGWLADDSVSEIMVNAPDEVYIERNGRLERTSTVFSGEAGVRRVIDRIVAPLGRRIDESTPLVDARLADGSRVNAVIPPLALKGATLTIRKFRRQRILPENLLEWRSIDEEGLSLLKDAVRRRRNILISGGTGAGKTTLLNVVSSFIPAGERIVTIEDAAELQLAQPHVVRLESRPPNLEGKGAITIRDLLRNSLRMRPDRIIVGECRGGEALDMLQAMNTGHDGGLSTVHANSPADALRRVETLVLFAGTDLPHRAVREQVAGAIHYIVQQSRLADGKRRVTEIAEVTGLDPDGYRVEVRWRFDKGEVSPGVAA